MHLDGLRIAIVIRSIFLQLSPKETPASPLYFEIVKWAVGTGCSVELPIPMGRPCIKIQKKALKVTAWGADTGFL
ncbi:MAG: hypothetical protein EZS28_035739 [Streblomastix strix]|uniref:Uncharacterized protein n=1 Tax=Streblomastix strix TaxID=222440 RepID=A0A5J4UFW7_9EUKA|nr:MAG: hypothetical protein EZS28_035739 [Streblomastix strix]